MTTVERQVAICAAGVLQAFNGAGVIEAADVHVAQRLCTLAGETERRPVG